MYQANLALGPIEAAGLKGQNGKANVALQTGDDDSGHISTVTIGDLYKLVGAKVVYSESNIPVPGPPASFTPFVNAILAAKPNILETLVNFQTAPGLTAAMTAGGFTGTNINFVGYIPGLLGTSAQLAAAFNGAYVSSQIVPQEAQTAYIKQMETDLVSSGAATGKFITLAIAIAYAQADVLVSMLKATGSTLNTKTFDTEDQQRELHLQVLGRRRPGSDGVPGDAPHRRRLCSCPEDQRPRGELHPDGSVHLLRQSGREDQQEEVALRIRAGGPASGAAGSRA